MRDDGRETADVDAELRNAKNLGYSLQTGLLFALGRERMRRDKVHQPVSACSVSASCANLPIRTKLVTQKPR